MGGMQYSSVLCTTGIRHDQIAAPLRSRQSVWLSCPRYEGQPNKHAQVAAEGGDDDRYLQLSPLWSCNNHQ